MLQDLKFQLATAILTILSIAAAAAAVVNFQQGLKFRLADDGISWSDSFSKSAPGRRVVASSVLVNGPGDRAGIRVGDQLVSIQNIPIETAIRVPELLGGVGAWGKAEYRLRRVKADYPAGVEFPAKVTVGEAPRGLAVNYQYLVGCVYLALGLFIYFRRGSAYKARHFYLFCLTSFVFCCFHYTGKLNPFDQAIYYGNLVCGWLAPAIFVHFCMTFPERRTWFRNWMLYAVYGPGILYTLVALRLASPIFVPLLESSSDVRFALDRIWMGLLAGYYLISGAILQTGYLRAEDPVIRQQLKWLRNGMLFGFGPFALLDAIPYILNIPVNPYLHYSVIALTLIPITIAYSILRYRLMDVDVIFRRGYAYTLATMCVLAAFYSIVFSLGSLVKDNFKGMGNSGLITTMLVATFLFQPIRNWIQERLDRYFYRDSYDYRRTLIEFARELNSEVDLDQMLQSLADRLMQTLSIRHVGFFLKCDDLKYGDAAGAVPVWRMRMSMGSSARPLGNPEQLDLSFLEWPRHTPYLFFDRTRYRLDAVASSWPNRVRQTIADLDLNYYLPCTVRGNTIAFLGVSRTETGEFLSSEDIELLMTLSNYVGIAIENSNLYRSLKKQVDENERLKEFSENIVESINVGILAAGLDDRVESWNTQMERMFGIGRLEAVGRTLHDLFPASLIEQLDRSRGEMRIHRLDKFAVETPGGEAMVNIVIAPLVSREMEQIGRLVIFDDVTDRAELERRLVQADKLSSIGLLAAGVAHEVNTPLAVISTYAQMLGKQVAGDEQKAKILEKIARQTFRASEIVNSLLNFSRTSTTELSEIHLNRIIQETVSLLEHQFNKAGIQVRLNFDEDLQTMKGNPGKLQQVFLNLFLNARDAMEPGGVLEVVTRSGEAGVEVDVIDNGHGIPTENVSRIYDPFFTTKGAKKGTGLGLSVTYGIIQEHNGAIEVFSRPGEGTRFHMSFPAVRKAVHA